MLAEMGWWTIRNPFRSEAYSRHQAGPIPWDRIAMATRPDSTPDGCGAAVIKPRLDPPVNREARPQSRIRELRRHAGRGPPWPKIRRHPSYRGADSNSARMRRAALSASLSIAGLHPPIRSRQIVSTDCLTISPR